jgi:hypothetical protein
LRFLDVSYNIITAGGCLSLVSLLEHPNSNLQKLDLGYNSIGNSGALVFADALASNNNLEELILSVNDITDEAALILANALTSNNKLKVLDLYGNNITAEGWSGFLKVLCDTSSINATFHSNHTLIGLGYDFYPNPLPDDVEDLLDLNEGNDDKKQVAMEKILMHHPHFDIHPFSEWDMNVLPIMIEWFERAGSHFDMQPLFEWDMKVLPLAVNWFERAGSIQNIDEAEVGKRKLDAIYQFICAMPMMYIDACTRRELDAISSLKTELQRKQQFLERMQLELFSKLKEVEDHEARAMRRL